MVKYEVICYNLIDNNYSQPWARKVFFFFTLQESWNGFKRSLVNFENFINSYGKLKNFLRKKNSISQANFLRVSRRGKQRNKMYS